MSTLYHSLASGDFSQSWSGTASSLTAGNWSSIASIMGYRGDNLTSNTATDPQTNLADGDGTPVDLLNASTATSSTGGIHEISDDVVALQGSGTADAPHLVLHLDATGRENIRFTATLRELDASTTDQRFAVQYRIGDSGDFTNLPSGAVSGVFNAAGNQTVNLDVTLPATANSQSQIQLRIITNDAPGSDAMIGIDDILVSSAPASGDPVVTINDVMLTETDSGTTIATFTVSASHTDTAFSVDYATADGTATLADNDYAAASGTLSFAAGDPLTKTISIVVNGDTVTEASEVFTVNLSNALGATIGDAQGVGTILNDDISVAKIHDIQGSAFFSPILAAEGISNFNIASSQEVTVQAVVTAIDTFGTVQGFYIAEELTDWDGSAATSEGIFVRTASAVSGLTVGETVTVTARVMEFQDFTNLNRTMLVNASSIVQANDAQSLPTLVIDGVTNRIPTSIISDDNPDFTDAYNLSGTFDPQNDALDFYETVEGMRVTVTNMVVADGFVGGSNDNFVYFNAYSADNADPALLNTRGGYTVTGDPQHYPVDTADPNDDVKFGGATSTDGATHGDILELDFGNVGRGGTSGFDQHLTMGDSLGDVSGIIDFDFGVAKLFVTDALDPAKVDALDDTTPVQEVTTLTGDDTRALRVATFNVENLSPVGTTFSTNNGVEITTADKYAKLASHIANNLDAPDILIIEEVQDNNGVTADSVTDASTTWQQLVDAVNAATGKVYQWVDEAPQTSGNVGGAPGGNIRVGFLYDTGRVQLGGLDADATLAERRQYTDRIGDGVRDAGDLLAVDDSGLGINPADWSGTRRSIVGEFTFNGQTVHVFGSHLPSKGGSGDPYIIDQNNTAGSPANGDWALRNTLAQDMWSVMDRAAQDGLVVSGGDFNEFWYNRPLEVLTGYANPDGSANTTGTDFSNLMVDELAPVDRFSYDFDGRSQALDTILADQALAAVAQYDVVHINTGYNGRTGAVNPASSDHDPSLASFDMRSFSETLSGTPGDDVIQGFGGDDSIDGGAGNDTALYADAWTEVDVNADGTIATATEGTDNLSNLETLRFAGTDVALADAVNDAPIGADDSVTGLAENGAGTATGNVLANDTDADVALGLGETLGVTGIRAGTELAGGTFSTVTGSALVTGLYGDLTINTDGSYSYALDQARAATQALTEGQTVEDYFTYQVADAHGLADAAQLSFEITGAREMDIGGITVYNAASSSLEGSATTPVATDDVVMVRLGSIAGASAGAESVAFENGKVYATNINGNAINVHTIAADGTLANAAPISLSGLPSYKTGGVNSVAVKNGVIAVAYENATAGANGYVALFNAADNSLIATVEVGVLPDMLTFTPDGSKLLVANEGEAISNLNNPVGGISIIDLSSGAASATVSNTIGFSALNGFEADLKAAGLTLFGGQSAAADIEPEYISVSPDGTRAYVTLQEVNAVAVIDLTNPTADRPLAIQPLGTVDWSLPGNTFDPSDRDGAGGTNSIKFVNADVQGVLQPDAVASFQVGGATYFITANEGDSRVGSGITDSVRLSSSSYVLDATAYPNAAALKADASLGRLNVLTNVGDTDNDGDIDQIYTLGGRSITIFKQEADGSITKVRETGGEFEAITAALIPASFNSNQSTSGFDGRSDDKGPEPEGVSIGEINGRIYAFVGLERVGGYMVYDVTDPENASFVSYKPQTASDLGPETSSFVSAANSPTGQALLVSGQEISNTVTVYSLQTQSEGNDTIRGGADAETWNGRGGNDSIQGNGGNDAINGGAGTDTAVFKGNRADYVITNQGTTVTDINLADGDEGTDTLTGIEQLQFADQTVATSSFQTFTLQLLHLSDGEAGLLASDTAKNLAAMVDAFEDDYAHSITLSGGDTYLPGPFLAGGTDPSLIPVINATTGSTISTAAGSTPAPGVVDTAIHNLIGVEASGIGNHEWDLGSNVYASTLAPGGGWVGAQYASISANLVLNPGAPYAADPLNGRFTQTVGVNGLEEASSLKGRIAPSAVITEGTEKIGLVGVTTQILESISSPTGAEILGFPYGPGANGETNDMALLAAQLQPVIDDLRAQGVNKIVLLSHLQQIQFEKALAPLLEGVDIILAAGSNTRLGDADDEAVSFPGHDANFADTYPIVTAGADGKTTLIVNTDNEYTYLGRLVVDFDSNGEIILDSVTANQSINGAYASTEENVAQAWGDLDGDLSDTAFAEGTRGDKVRDLTDAVQDVIEAKDGNVYGYSNVYLEGERIQVRNQETNLGNLSADANADAARDALGLTADHAIVSIKNGGGIRAQIGTIVNNPDGTVTKVAPAVDGEVSQLDVENALRFDNKLMVFDTTAQGLLNILNSPNALAPNNGGFIQIGGVRFSYDPTKAAGSRVQDVVLVNENGEITAVIADNGVVNPNAPSVITAVALNFTANGGDGYLVKANADNFRYILNDGTLSAPVSETLNFTDPAVVPANAIGEQQAFAEYMSERHGTRETAFNEADTAQALDTRIQNQSARADTVLQGEYLTLGTDGRDTLTGTEGAETLKGLAGNDTLNALGGDDTLNGGLGTDQLNGGDGTDTATYATATAGVSASLKTGKGTFGEALGDRFISIENLTGSAYDDVLGGNRLANVIDGGAGNDIIDGNGGADTLNGGAGDDMFVQSSRGSSVAAIHGGDGLDTLAAGIDNAIFTLPASISGVEIISADGYSNVTIGGSNGADILDLSTYTLDGIAAVRAGSGDDTAIGSNGADRIEGGNGSDLLRGGAGNDILVGGTGLDTLFGDAGNDVFLFGKSDSNKQAGLADHIKDFVTGEDLIDLSLIDANTLNGSGNDAFTFIGSAAFGRTAGELRVAGFGVDLLVSGDWNGDGKADFTISVDSIGSLSAADFLL